ncbi:ROK family protein [Haloferula rosea]|uniref:ROK family protein n=1 Tax=Haloferula rosea TaxID=490093 RepID=A0A934REH6_9BACT|nr:ROK family protein [Haloferula rosea]MBK1827651.1 ROK family protein [Haloferula rosea]
MSANPNTDERAVMALDAGGTNFKFSAIRGNEPAIEPFSVPSNAHDLELCLATLVDGFKRVRNSLPDNPVAISFAFPGPCDYPNGIVGDLKNLPCFRGGVALKAMLEEVFDIPTFINNDGDLFVYGEAIAGLLPEVNELLAKAGSPKRYRNLFGVTLGTGFGGGIVRNGQLFLGDNISAAEVWTLRNKIDRDMPAEEGACIRAVRRTYAEQTGIPFDEAPDPRTIYEIGVGTTEGNQQAAVAAFQRLGEVAGDAIAQALTLIDGLAVIGGGISGAHPLFLPSIIAEINGNFRTPNGETQRRLTQLAFNLEDPTQVETFLKGDTREIIIPGTTRTTQYDPMPRVGVGISRLGTSEAVAIGAYAFALNQLDSQ